jgi:hypothetical protein
MKISPSRNGISYHIRIETRGDRVEILPALRVEMVEDRRHGRVAHRLLLRGGGRIGVD